MALRLASRLVTDTGPVRGVPSFGKAIERSPQTRRHSAGSIRARILFIDRARLDNAFVGVEEIADVVLHGFGDADAREELQIDADPKKPGRVGEMPPLVDDVLDESARVQRRLVTADVEHGEPGVVLDTRVRDMGGSGLAGSVGRHDAFDDPLVEPTEVPDIADVETGLVCCEDLAASQGPDGNVRAAKETGGKAELLPGQVRCR